MGNNQSANAISINPNFCRDMAKRHILVSNLYSAADALYMMLMKWESTDPPQTEREWLSRLIPASNQVRNQCMDYGQQYMGDVEVFRLNYISLFEYISEEFNSIEAELGTDSPDKNKIKGYLQISLNTLQQFPAHYAQVLSMIQEGMQNLYSPAENVTSIIKQWMIAYNEEIETYSENLTTYNIEVDIIKIWKSSFSAMMTFAGVVLDPELEPEIKLLAKIESDTINFVLQDVAFQMEKLQQLRDDITNVAAHQKQLLLLCSHVSSRSEQIPKFEPFTAAMDPFSGIEPDITSFQKNISNAITTINTFDKSSLELLEGQLADLQQSIKGIQLNNMEVNMAQLGQGMDATAVNAKLASSSSMSLQAWWSRLS